MKKLRANTVFLKDLFFNAYLNMIRMNYSFVIDNFMSFKVFPLKADILRKFSLNSGNFFWIVGTEDLRTNGLQTNGLRTNGLHDKMPNEEAPTDKSPKG